MKKANNDRGIIMFAHNNAEIDYFKLAVVNSFLIQRHLGIKNITVVTDPASLDYAEKSLGKKVIKQAINNIIVVEKDKEFKIANTRIYKDTSHTAKPLSFYNVNRCDAYDLSPYEETILLDVDYLILSDTLNQCWGHNEELMLNWRYQDIMYERKDPTLNRLNDFGVTMYWATVVYFRKTPYVESFFNCVKHVRNNPQYYKDLYKWNGTLYRNDYSFSIAAHMMTGFQDRGIPQLPTTLYKTFDTDDIHCAVDDHTLIMYLEKPRSPGDFMLTKWSGVDLHVMNKWAINRISEDMLNYVRNDL
jgi:hypothetical protein